MTTELFTPFQQASPSAYTQSIEAVRLAGIFEQVTQGGGTVTSVPTSSPLGAMIPVQMIPTRVAEMIEQIGSVSATDPLAEPIRVNISTAQQILQTMALKAA